MACTTSGCGLCLIQQIKVQKEQAFGDTKKELRNGTFIGVIIIILVEMCFRNLGLSESKCVIKASIPCNACGTSIDSQFFPGGLLALCL